MLTGYFSLHIAPSYYQVCIWNTSIFCIKENQAILKSLLPIPLTRNPREFLGFYCSIFWGGGKSRAQAFLRYTKQYDEHFQLTQSSSR